MAAPLVPHPPLRDYYGGEGERRGYVGNLFDVTARHYDWINRVMSFGSGIWYRRQALRRIGLAPGAAVLDVCIGSAQVARPALELVGPSGQVVGLDASMGMLVQARGFVRIPLVQAYAERLPVADGSFDLVTMGYALRHMADLNATFGEYRRVLKPGGKLLILELTRPSTRARYHLVRFYMQRVVPTLAGLRGARARTLMRYYWDTIENCVPPSTILAALAASGFVEPKRDALFDLFSEYTPTKPA